MKLTQSSMPKASPVLQIFLVLMVTVFLIIIAHDSIWSASADLAHHYALVARITEYWILPPGIDPTLGEMNYYPRTSHLLAAITGKFFGSPLIGIQLVSLLSLIVLWAGLAFMILSMPRSVGMKTAATLSVLLVLNGVLLRMDVHGGEIVGNFFYSQLVAQALIVLGLAVALSLDRKGIKPSIRYSFLIALIYFATGIHLLPASQLLCFLLAMIAFEAFMELKATRKNYVKTGLVAAGFMGTGLLVLTTHPAFTAMRTISQNNGDLSTNRINSMGAISVYCLIVAAMSGILVFQWFKLQQQNNTRQLLALKYLGLYGLAVSGVCLAQLISLKIGQGSEYAVKKHMFALNTVILIEVALIPLLVKFPKMQHSLQPNINNEDVLYSCLLLPALTALAFFSVTPYRKVLATSDIVSLEHQLQLQRERLISYTPDKYVYLLPSPNISPIVAYMMTIGVLKAPRTDNSLNVLRDQPLTEWPLVGSILASETSYVGQLTSCRRSFPALPLSVVDGQCVKKEMHRGRRSISLSAIDGYSPCLIDGFSAAEEGGRWTERKEVLLKCSMPNLDGKAPAKILIDTAAFLHNGNIQRASFSINGSPPIEYRYDAEHPKRIIELPLPASVGKESAIQFSLPDAISPKQMGLSEDRRQLGLMVRAIEFH